ncbi:exopolyphosphatase/guanosine-5'-triphosphate,3'-diphosphate pyrophosphatase [Catalinimonas alkaloidigena]|uniref:Ppx/GppA phosphatase family protein n=1 Tax=Catalinimonas alkaloidigena TaxID=1075417 RepID=UPI0024049E2B|nr:phosphatase [Catalinimonas alkaloidigena]MDF9794827.1 exopolyphosphatase/guanosine-5'-triphosphate,3'-diphosphate pyrophosphatase [Catalinimonas alkaloidigena]
MRKLAAIDIGSNAIRLQVSSVISYEEKTTFKKLEYVRFPLRLGQDVFGDNEDEPSHRIGATSSAKFLKLMKAFKLLIDLYEVDDYMGCATSAMREAENGHQLIAQVRDEYGLELEIIDGDAEAEILNNALKSFLEENKTYLHIDVGGGSTELNLYVNKEKVVAHSFPIGSVRKLNTRKSLEQVWNEMGQWVKENVKKNYGTPIAIGTGGNINKIFDLSGTKNGKILTLNKLISTRDFLASHTLEERINKLQLNPDRADVIIPASNIYISAMQWARTSKILVPKLGLKDGVMQMLYEKHQLKVS